MLPSAMLTFQFTVSGLVQECWHTRPRRMTRMWPEHVMDTASHCKWDRCPQDLTGVLFVMSQSSRQSFFKHHYWFGQQHMHHNLRSRMSSYSWNPLMLISRRYSSKCWCPITPSLIISRQKLVWNSLLYPPLWLVTNLSPVETLGFIS